jgi:polysaccharide biosynthesis/export protein
MKALFPALALCGLLACADVGKFVWVQDYVPPPDPQGFVLGPGDVVLVRMFGQEAFTTRARIRSDGRISLPLLNDVDAAGYTPASLGQQLDTRYKDFVKVPAVTVSVEDAQPLQLPVAGEVGKPGVVAADRGATLLTVLLQAGGLTDFAHRDRIFVVRRAPQPVRIRFSWKELLRDGDGGRFQLRTGDLVVVE